MNSILNTLEKDNVYQNVHIFLNKPLKDTKNYEHINTQNYEHISRVLEFYQLTQFSLSSAQPTGFKVYDWFPSGEAQLFSQSKGFAIGSLSLRKLGPPVYAQLRAVVCVIHVTYGKLTGSLLARSTTKCQHLLMNISKAETSAIFRKRKPCSLASIEITSIETTYVVSYIL